MLNIEQIQQSIARSQASVEEMRAINQKMNNNHHLISVLHSAMIGAIVGGLTVFLLTVIADMVG
ncbi:MAG: hypothetical protein Q4G13_07780 [Moraxella sp.]|nr:hypothetical protein [Moraxella sp.]